MLPWFGLLVIDVDFQAEAKLAAVRIRAADGAPRLVAALAAAGGVACAPERVEPLQQGVSVSALSARLSSSCNTRTQQVVTFRTKKMIIIFPYKHNYNKAYKNYLNLIVHCLPYCCCVSPLTIEVNE